jgi:hypothetical protein
LNTLYVFRSFLSKCRATMTTIVKAISTAHLGNDTKQKQKELKTKNRGHSVVYIDCGEKYTNAIAELRNLTIASMTLRQADNNVFSSRIIIHSVNMFYLESRASVVENRSSPLRNAVYRIT